MIRKTTTEGAIRQLAWQLDASHPLRFLPSRDLPRAILPGKVFLPDYCFQQDSDYFLVYPIPTPEIPEWITGARHVLQARQNLKLILLASQSEEFSGPSIAHAIANQARELQYGLAVQTRDGVFLVFPPNFREPRPTRSKAEYGHIPSWIFRRASEGTSTSNHMRDCITRFRDNYERTIDNRQIDYHRECHLLYQLAEEITHGDPRLFYPMDRLEALRGFERTHADPSARDHYFHTFNIFFLGMIVLDELFTSRADLTFPDSLIKLNRRRSCSKLWESLWFLTSMFHDPGYIPQNIWSLISYAYGIENTVAPETPVPEEVIERIEDVWETEFLNAKEKLFGVYDVINKSVQRSRANYREELNRFKRGLRAAYFDGLRAGHSLISGLTLVNLCLSDTTAPHPHFSRPTSVVACTLASLSMLFHDQHCREKLLNHEIPRIPFRVLPYASLLMFVDALQDDRRDVRTSRFSKDGVLESLKIDAANGLVTAKVRLRNIPLEHWAGRIAEYESVMRWINPDSEVKFLIDYHSGLWA
ncbi:MAG: hypothetical protein ABSF91_10295 [Bacteroidota bacterium]|jgi:hypothetical protein